MMQPDVLIRPEPKLLSLAQTLNELLRHQSSGAALPECYGDRTGALTWAHFARVSDPKIQYTFQSEAGAIRRNGAAIASLIANDPDVDISNLIVIEKGNGAREAMLSKSFCLMGFFQEVGMDIALYSPWEGAQEYREDGKWTAHEEMPHADVSEQDVDFNKDDPDISTLLVKDVERPRIVMEFGSTRGNIPTRHDDPRSFEAQTYAELRKRFAHDRKICRDGGILIVGSDENNTPSARGAYIHPVHAKFAENVIQRGRREGALSQDFDPQLLYYDPIWDERDHVVRHTLVACADQEYGILDASGQFRRASMKENDHFVLSHSIKWPEQKMIAAAQSQGFKCLGVYRGDDNRVPIYVFKAIDPIHGRGLHLVH